MRIRELEPETQFYTVNTEKTDQWTSIVDEILYFPVFKADHFSGMLTLFDISMFSIFPNKKQT